MAVGILSISLVLATGLLWYVGLRCRARATGQASEQPVGLSDRRQARLSIRMSKFALALALCSSVVVSAADKPNFIVIFVDDLGYADIGPFGSKLHRTPNLDKMAAEGRKLTSFYVTAPVCTPSRSSLMTGSYPRRVGLDESEKGQWVLFPGNQEGLNPDEITLAETLKAVGYKTACVGKWHLGDQLPFLPTRHGFDSYFGIPYSNDMGH